VRGEGIVFFLLIIAVNPDIGSCLIFN